MREVDESFRDMLKGNGLTTVRIFYHLPKAPSILGEFILQFYDVYPRFPQLYGYLKFWETHIEARIHSVEYAHQQLIKPSEIRMVGSEFRLQ